MPPLFDNPRRTINRMGNTDYQPLPDVANLTYGIIGATGIRKAAQEHRIDAINPTGRQWQVNINDPTVKEWIRKAREDFQQRSERLREQRATHELVEENQQLRAELDTAQRMRMLMEQELMDRAAALEALCRETLDTNRMLASALQDAVEELRGIRREEHQRIVIHSVRRG